MRRIAAQSPEMVCTERSRDEARALLAAQDQTYKVEAVDMIAADERITFWSHGDWADLCEGPHVDRLDRPFHFKLLSLAGAYWRGDE